MLGVLSPHMGIVGRFILTHNIIGTKTVIVKISFLVIFFIVIVLDGFLVL
jgi:hypothetical protein